MPTVKPPEPPSSVPEIIRTREGEPWLFVARPGELAEAMAAIPDTVFLEAFAYVWRGREDAPKPTAAEIRKHAFEVHMDSPLLRGAGYMSREGRRVALRRPRRWHIIPSRMAPDPRMSQ